MGQADLLHELHDAYVWAIKAAVGEDRMDLVTPTPPVRRWSSGARAPSGPHER